MCAEAEPKKKTIIEKWNILLEKHPEKIANLSIILPLFIIAFLIAIWKIYGINIITGTVIVLLATLVICSIFFLINSARQIVEGVKEEAVESYYVISKWRIETLKNAGVPKDITGFLTELIRDKETKILGELEMRESTDTKDKWLVQLKQELGETRVEEFEETILKYTRCDTEDNS